MGIFDFLKAKKNTASIAKERLRSFIERIERLEEELPDLEMALQFTDRPDARLRNINLSVEEWRVVSYINPKNSMKQIARANNMNEFQIRKVIYGMLQAGLVELVTPQGYVPPQLAEMRRPVVAQKKPSKSLVQRLIGRIQSIPDK